MSHTLVVRPLSALVVILAGSALLAAPVMAGEEEAQAQERIQQAESGPAEAQGDDGEVEATDDDVLEGDEQPAHQGNDSGHDHEHAMHDEDEHADNEAVQAYREVNRRMHEDMSIDFTGDADADFARGMIPHHQGAIDMANVVLLHGEDQAIRDLAREVIEAQEEEIAFLRDWLVQHGYEVD